MTSKFVQFVEELRKTSSTEEIEAVLHELRDAYRLANVAYLICKIPGSAEPYPFHLVTYSEPWRRQYSTMDYFSVDPTVQFAQQRFRPLDWSNVMDSAPDARDFFADAESYGVGRHGLSLPITGESRGDRAMFSFTSNKDEPEWKQDRVILARDMFYIGHLLHDRVIAMGQAEGLFAAPVTLTDAEKLCLAGVHAGRVPKQIAADVNVAVKTVNNHLQRAREKLGCNTNAGAVVRAIELNLI